MMQESVKIYDTTVRDGLRNSGISLSLTQKLRFVRQLEQLQVDAIEVGYGGPTQVDSMRQLAKEVTGPVVFGLSRVNLKDVQRVLDGVEHAKKPGVNIFSPTSDIFLQKTHLSRQQALDATVKAVTHAKRYVDHVAFSAQDASRADPAYLVEICTAAIAAGATTVSIADSVSYALPQQFGQLCDFLRTQTPGGREITWSVHCHNDQGLAVANSLAAIEHGVRQVECTVNGIGERAGNTPMQHVINVLRLRADAFPSINTTVAFAQLPATSHLLAELTGKGTPTLERE